jgi:hypothetical protein
VVAELRRHAGGAFVIVGIGIAYIGWGTWWPAADS